MAKITLSDEKLQARLLNQFEVLRVLRMLNLPSLARKCGLQKQQGEDGLKIFISLFISVFTSCTIAQFVRKAQGSVFGLKKDTAYRYAQRRSIHWRKLLLCVAMRAVGVLGKYYPDNGRYLTIDDSQLEKTGKHIEYLSWIFDKSKKRSTMGFEIPCLSYTDGTSTIPLDFAIKSSANRVSEHFEPVDLDGRSSPAKRRMEVGMKKTDLVLEMLARAQKKGFEADAVLFDSWYCYPKLVGKIYHEIGYNVCAQLKATKTIMVTYQGKPYSTQQLWSAVVPSLRAKVITVRNVDVEVRSMRADFGNTPVKLVFCRPVDKRSHYKPIILLSTLTHHSEQEVIDAYAKRWSIETLFKEIKHTWDFGKNQCRNFESNVCFITISMIRSIVFTIMQRQEEDYRHKGTLFEKTECELQTLNTLFNLDQYIKLIHELCDEVLKSSAAVLIEQIAAFQHRIKDCVVKMLFQGCET
jgi:hypothetical protein